MERVTQFERPEIETILFGAQFDPSLTGGSATVSDGWSAETGLGPARIALHTELVGTVRTLTDGADSPTITEVES